MSSAQKRVNRIYTSRWLSWRLIMFLTLLTVFFASVADYFLYQSLLEKDRSLLEARASTYLRVYNNGGLETLIETVDNENNAPDLWLVEIHGDDNPVRHIVGNASHQEVRHSDPFWPVVDTAEKRWLIHTVDLNEHIELVLGMNSIPRQSQLVEYRWAMAAVLLSVLVFSALMFRRIYDQTLLPIRDLLLATSHIQQTRNLSERVTVRNPETELGLLTLQTNEFLETIEKLVLSMRGALDNVAHDLRTPMTRMQLQIERMLMQKDIQKQPELLQELGMLSDESEYMSAMLKTLIDISEAESGILRLDCQKFVVKPELMQLIDIYGFLAEEKDIGVTLNCDEDTVLYADPIRFKRAIGNLLDNAVKFSPEQTEISLNVVNTGTAIRIEIVDQGPGIASQDLPHVFERLYRSDKTRSSPGLGLGLSLVYAIAHAHGGSIDASNRVEANTKGARFVISFPQSER